MTKEELKQYLKENLTVRVYTSYDDNYVRVSLELEGEEISGDKDSVQVRIIDADHN